jgi:hypothetical protein
MHGRIVEAIRKRDSIVLLDEIPERGATTQAQSDIRLRM